MKIKQNAGRPRAAKLKTAPRPGHKYHNTQKKRMLSKQVDDMKIPKAKKLPSGSWRIQLRLGGRSVSVTELTEQSCIKKATLLKAEHIAGKAPVRRDTAPTLEKLLDSYIKAKKAVLSPSTVRGYEAIKRTRFLAYMDRDPDKINWQRAVGDESRLCGPKTLRNAWALVSAALAFDLKPVPPVTLPQVVQDEHPYLEAEQIPTFLDAMRDNPFELPALLGLHGLRRSEMFALTWADVDLSPRHSERSEESVPPSLGFLHVRGALVHDADGKLVKKKENKNRSSRRTVPIMIPRLRDLLLALQSDRRDGSQPSASPSAPILTCHPNSVYKAVNSVCNKAGLPLIGVHGLRHSFASLAHALGVPEAEAMALGGWEDPQTMRKIYTHLDAAARLKSANKISNFFSDCSRENAHGSQT